MDDRGQISAEYLLLIVVILVILGSISIPLMGKSIDASNDISWTSDAKNAVNSIANAVNLVYANGPSSKRSLAVYIPRDGMQVQSTSNILKLTTPLSSGGANKTVNATINYPITSNLATLNKNYYNVTVYWDVGKTSINVNFTAT
jgi:uncharacterized protein (UPF0333 family)